MSSKSQKYEVSKELRLMFSEQLEQWRKRERAGLEELARRCGVSPAYLAHVGRYGRIPSRPVLILLALNFGMSNPKQLLAAAGFKDSWPYDSDIRLGASLASDPGLLQIKLDMNGFANAIREIVKAEIKPRAVQDILRGRVLRIGLNPLKHWLFDKQFPGGSYQEHDGFFCQICNMLALSLKCRLEFKVVEYQDYFEMFARDELDMFGPIVSAPNLAGATVFSSPLYRIGMSALQRALPNAELAPLKAPLKVQQLIDGPYHIAVVRNSRAHLLANTRFKRPDSQLVICQTFDEAMDRIMFRGIKKAAHVFLTNAVDARFLHQAHPKESILLFNEPSNLLDWADCGIAVRSDWPELVNAINEFINFIDTSGALADLFDNWAPTEAKGIIKSLTPRNISPRIRDKRGSES